MRIPAGQSLGGRSKCDTCGAQLGLADLVPLFGYLASRGKSRCCHQRVAARYPLVECTAAAVGALAFGTDPGVEGLLGALFGWQLLALALTDVEHLRLPNRQTFLLAATGIGQSLLTPERLQDNLIGTAAGFCALSLIRLGYQALRHQEGMGGGDPKMLGAIGAWLGWQALPVVLVGASGIGLAFALWLALRGAPVTRTQRLPFGALLSIAAFGQWLWSVSA